MDELSYSTVKQFASDHDWEVIDEYQMGGTDWSVTATVDAFRISIDIPRTEPRLNNIFITGPRFSIKNTDDFTELCNRLPSTWEYALKTDDLSVSQRRMNRAIQSNNASIIQALLDEGVALYFVPIIEAHSGELCLSEIVERVDTLQQSFKEDGYRRHKSFLD